MAVVVNTNVDSIKIQHNLTNTTNKMSTAMQRMSTGLKVLTAKDDAAGTVIAARMKVQLDGNAICQKNVQNANAMMSTAEGNLDVVEQNLSRIRDLILQAKNGTYSDDEKRAMQDEISARAQEIDRISDSATYSDLQLFGGPLAATGVSFQVGVYADQDNVIEAEGGLFASVKFFDITGLNTEFRIVPEKEEETDDGTAADAGGTEGTEATGGTEGTEAAGGTEGVETHAEGGDTTIVDLDEALRSLDNGIDNITGRKSLIGSTQNRLESAFDTLTKKQENLSTAKSIITDADIASEASNYTQQSILQQVSTSLLAQANQAPAIALSLI